MAACRRKVVPFETVAVGYPAISGLCRQASHRRFATPDPDVDRRLRGRRRRGIVKLVIAPFKRDRLFSGPDKPQDRHGLAYMSQRLGARPDRPPDPGDRVPYAPATKAKFETARRHGFQGPGRLGHYRGLAESKVDNVRENADRLRRPEHGRKESPIVQVLRPIRVVGRSDQVIAEVLGHLGLP
jgi:hypothetical protein